MTDADHLRQKAQHCRELAEVAIMPDVREQLGLFAADFEEDATAVEGRARRR
jgi:hypothetical protein